METFYIDFNGDFSIQCNPDELDEILENIKKDFENGLYKIQARHFKEMSSLNFDINLIS